MMFKYLAKPLCSSRLSTSTITNVCYSHEEWKRSQNCAEWRLVLRRSAKKFKTSQNNISSKLCIQDTNEIQAHVLAPQT